MESNVEREESTGLPDFYNTEIAFSNRTDKELHFIYWLFSIMQKGWTVNFGSRLGLFAVKYRLPFFASIVKKTMFYHFCGGENLDDCKGIIEHMGHFNVSGILDYGAEAKSSPSELDRVADEVIKAIQFAGNHQQLPVVSIKITGLALDSILEKLNNKEVLSDEDEAARERMWSRVNRICETASQNDVQIYVDAEESWIQVAIDDMVDHLMEKYNTEKALIFNTYQLYRHDKLEQLKKDHQKAKSKGYVLGAKLVRGAYIEKETVRARELNMPSPIHPDKEAVDRDYNAALEYCIHHLDEISVCCATHNMDSSRFLADWMEKLNIARNHPNVRFSQLLGMSDFITFNMARAGYNASKLIPYGPVKEVIPYLIRRAQENTSVTGEMSRELDFVMREMKRRGLK